jgi:hypothetical protein
LKGLWLLDILLLENENIIRKISAVRDMVKVSILNKTNQQAPQETIMTKSRDLGDR